MLHQMLQGMVSLLEVMEHHPQQGMAHHPQAISLLQVNIPQDLGSIHQGQDLLLTNQQDLVHNNQVFIYILNFFRI